MLPHPEATPDLSLSPLRFYIWVRVRVRVRVRFRLRVRVRVGARARVRVRVRVRVMLRVKFRVRGKGQKNLPLKKLVSFGVFFLPMIRQRVRHSANKFGCERLVSIQTCWTSA
jgi:hypothetical protein